MTRESHEVDISNIERAQMCNEAQADLVVRIHADGDSSPKTQGISLLYPAWSEGTQRIYSQSKEAAEIILHEAAAATGAVSRGAVPALRSYRIQLVGGAFCFGGNGIYDKSGGR